MSWRQEHSAIRHCQGPPSPKDGSNFRPRAETVPPRNPNRNPGVTIDAQGLPGGDIPAARTSRSRAIVQTQHGRTRPIAQRRRDRGAEGGRWLRIRPWPSAIVGGRSRLWSSRREFEQHRIDQYWIQARPSLFLACGLAEMREKNLGTITSYNQYCGCIQAGSICHRSQCASARSREHAAYPGGVASQRR